jgi:hypothetical protein
MMMMIAHHSDQKKPLPSCSVTLCAALVLSPDLAAPTHGQTSPPPTFSVSADAPATPRGSVEISPTTGALVRAIPIEVPAFHGIEPRLALSYSSLSGNGFAGVGRPPPWGTRPWS